MSWSKDGFDDLGERVAGESGGEQQQPRLTPGVAGGLLDGPGAADRFGGTSMGVEREAQGEVADEEVHGGAGDQTELGHRTQPSAAGPGRDRLRRSRRPRAGRVVPAGRVPHSPRLGLPPGCEPVSYTHLTLPTN